jgi:hypothetical protein
VSTRPITAAAQAAAAQAQIIALLFVELDFTSGFLRVTSAGHDVTWNGYTWTGVGQLGAIEAIREDTSLQANGIKLSLSAVDTAIISIALGENYQGRAAKIWCAFINVDTGAIVADPLGPWQYRMDHMEVADGENAAVVLQLENEFAAWDRPNVRRFTDADQKRVYPNDRGFEFITAAAVSTLSWGRG